jgi:hypothetical protein
MAGAKGESDRYRAGSWSGLNASCVSSSSWGHAVRHDTRRNHGRTMLR